MRRVLIGATLASACAMLLATSVPARALMVMRPTSPWQNLRQADTVVVGQVAQILDQDIKAPAAPKSKQQVTYRIAIVAVRDTIKGKMKGNVIRVGFVPPPQNPQVPGGIVPPNGAPGGIRPQPQPLPPVRPGVARPGVVRPGFVRPGFRRYSVQLSQGMDGMFFLTKHHTGKFYTVVPLNGYINSSNKKGFDKVVSLTKKAPKVLKNVPAGLNSKDSEECLLAASELVNKYRGRGSPKTEPISAKESKKILKALLDVDWDYELYSYTYQVNPQNMFARLGIGQNDGFQRPRPVPGQNYNEIFETAAKNWIRNNMNKYRIQRFVPQPGRRPGPGGRPIGRPGGGPIRIQPVPGKIQILPAQPGQAQPGRRIILPVQPAQGQGQAQPGQAGGGIQIQIQVQPAAPAVPAAPPAKENGK